MNRGAWVIVVMVLLGIASGVVAVGYQYSQQNRAIQFWGKEAATLIRHAPVVEAMRLTPAKSTAGQDDQGTTITIGENSYNVSGQKAVHKLRGFLHGRYALIVNASFHWDDPNPSCASDWQFAFRFIDDTKEVVVLFDARCFRVRLLNGGSEVALDKKIFDGLKAYAEDQGKN